MNSGKLKNIIIIILVLLDAALLTIAVSAAAGSRSAAARSENAVRDVLAAHGMELGADIDIMRSAPTMYSLERDLEREAALAENLIGSAVSEDLGGNIIYYKGENGQLQLRGTGRFEGMFTAGGSDDLPRLAKNAASKLGMSTDSSCMSVDAGSSTVSLVPRFEGLRVFNAVNTFTFSEDGLAIVSGTRLFDRRSEQAGTRTLSCADAILRFVNLASSEGYVCSRIEDIEPGYLVNVSISGESTLLPVWHFVTDTVELYINGVTGRPETPS